ncbi:hypothetical protein MUO65_06230 [bacterium]|nr:hypothetical protein [bacterium]
MPMCFLTVLIGIGIILIGGGGGLKVSGFAGMTIGGSVGAVVTFLGLIGIGC